MENKFIPNDSSDRIVKPLDIYRVCVVDEDCIYTPKGFQSREDAIRLAEELSEHHSLVEVRQPVEISYQLSHRQVWDRVEYNVIYSCCTISLD
jgi:hypothetical protein